MSLNVDVVGSEPGRSSNKLGGDHHVLVVSQKVSVEIWTGKRHGGVQPDSLHFQEVVGGDEGSLC